jgi:hypothetical protein
MLKFLRRFWISAPIVLTVLFAFAGCGDGGGRYDEKASPHLESVQLSSYNEGTSETQYVVMALAFDKQIKADGFAPKIRIANENVKNEDIVTEAKGAVLTITIHVGKSREGNITLKLGDEEKKTLPKITDESGVYAAKAQTIEALAPSGVTLETSHAESGSVTVEVTHGFNIRGIAWVLFTDNGKPVQASLLNGADERDGAVAVHGHEFLQDDAYDIAANLAETLTSHFGDRYVFTAEGKTVTARSLTNAAAQLEIKIYNME